MAIAGSKSFQTSPPKYPSPCPYTLLSSIMLQLLTGGHQGVTDKENGPQPTSKRGYSSAS